MQPSPQTPLDWAVGIRVGGAVLHPPRVWPGGPGRGRRHPRRPDIHGAQAEAEAAMMIGGEKRGRGVGLLFEWNAPLSFVVYFFEPVV